jgi:hypothetical protein
VTNLRRHAKKVVAFYNGRGTAEQWIIHGPLPGATLRGGGEENPVAVIHSACVMG